MKRVLLPLSAITLLLFLVATTFVNSLEAKVKPASDLPVTSVIDGLGVDTIPTLRVQSDLSGAYLNSTSLQSIIQGIGDWELDMLNFDSNPQRRVLIDLRDPVPGSGPNGSNPTAPFDYHLVRARFLTQCPSGISMLNMLPNNVFSCPMVLGFDDPSGQRYRLAQYPANYSETNAVSVSCLAINPVSGRCNQWKLVPSVTQLDGELKNRAKLLKITTQHNQQIDQDMGDFYLSFSIHVTNP